MDGFERGVVPPGRYAQGGREQSNWRVLCNDDNVPQVEDLDGDH